MPREIENTIRDLTMRLSELRTQLDHRFAEHSLSAYLDGMLTDREKRRVERHLAACPECERELEGLRETVALLRLTPPLARTRSFALPMSAQAEQNSFRRWNRAHGALRGAAVAVSLGLVLLLSGDALIGTGLLGSGSLRTMAVPDRMAERPAMIERAAETIVEKVEREEPAAPAPAAKAEVVPETAMKGQPAAVPSSPVARSAAEPDAAREEGERGVLQLRSPAQEAAPADEASPAVRAFGAETAAGKRAPAAPAPERELAPTPEVQPTQVGSASDPTAPVPRPTIVREAAPTRVVTATPERLAAVAVPEPTQSAPLPERSESVPPASEGSRLWAVWRGVRLGAGILLGTLLVVLGGLVWVGHKRRI